MVEKSILYGDNVITSSYDTSFFFLLFFVSVRDLF